MATQRRLRAVSFLSSGSYFAHSTPDWRERDSTVDSGRLSAALRTQPAKMLFHLEILFSLPSGPLRLHPVSFHSGRMLQVLLRWRIGAVVAMARAWVRLECGSFWSSQAEAIIRPGTCLLFSHFTFAASVSPVCSRCSLCSSHPMLDAVAQPGREDASCPE
jgi:hypothetical protein